LVLFWAVGALKTRPTKRTESFASRFGVTFIMAAGLVCIFSDAPQLGVLDRRFIPDNFVVAVAGVVLVWLGIGLALWARYHLGQNWSARVTVKEGHELIRTGPYARLRHPIYTGLLVALTGSVLEKGEWRCMLGVAFALAGLSLKALREEAMLTEQFGDRFVDHRRSTGFLVPRLR
jgi:protein-S-isoprenylcysteine O-methyltransferase Ste14